MNNYTEKDDKFFLLMLEVNERTARLEERIADMEARQKDISSEVQKLANSQHDFEKSVNKWIGKATAAFAIIALVAPKLWEMITS